MLLRHLPRDSAYVRAWAGDQAAWGDTEHLLAGVIDAVQIGNFYTEVMASGRRMKSTPKPPTALLRPGDDTGRKAGGEPVEQLQARLAMWRAGELEMIETTAKEVS